MIVFISCWGILSTLNMFHPLTTRLQISKSTAVLSSEVFLFAGLIRLLCLWIFQSARLFYSCVVRVTKRQQLLWWGKKNSWSRGWGYWRLNPEPFHWAPNHMSKPPRLSLMTCAIHTFCGQHGVWAFRAGTVWGTGDWIRVLVLARLSLDCKLSP